jgi:hypothetical protein|tara:strand:+ start:440 stop:664 length:225 start_codon:yes stop_codon:yes gene_type:complete
MLDKSVARESFTDVGIGFVIAFPIAFIVLNITTYLELSVAATAFTQTIVFTVVSLVRKYFVRLFFKTNGKTKQI